MKKIIDDIRLIFKCCSLYYQDGLSQQEISDILQISRPTVARMIKNGHQQGIVKIEVINPNNLLFGNLERALEKKFNLEEVIVTPATNSNLIDDVDETMANEVFKFLSRILNENDYVGIGMGRTLRNLIKNKCQVEPLKCTFVPTMGGIDENRYDIHSNYIASAFANIFQADCLQFFSPLLFSNHEMFERFMQEHSMQRITTALKKLSVIVLGIGVPSKETSTLVKEHYISEDLFDKFKQSGMIGDILAQFFDKHGNSEQFESFNKLVSSLPIDEIKKIHCRVAIVSGKHKVDSLIGAIKGKFVNVLIIDSACADELLAYKEV